MSEVEVGIDRTYALLKANQLLFFDDLVGLIGGDDTDGELSTYSRELDEEGEPTDVIEDKSTFHRLDALRYAATLIGQQPKKGTATGAQAVTQAAVRAGARAAQTTTTSTLAAHRAALARKR